MKKIRIISALCVLAVTVGAFTSCFGEKKSVNVNTEVFTSIFEDISEDNIYSTIEELSSKKYLGRLTGSEGNELATKYIQDEFKKIGLDEFQGMDEFLDIYEQDVYWLDEAPEVKIFDDSSEEIGNLQFHNDFTTYAAEGIALEGKVKGKVLLITEESQVKELGENISDKIVVIDRNLTEMHKWREIITNEKLIPKAVFVNLQHRSGGESFKKYVIMPQQGNFRTKRKNYLYGFVDASGYKKLQEAAEKDQMVEYTLKYNHEKKQVSNVVGMIPGTDEKLKDEYIIISGHFDHLGDNLDGDYNPGASDNASGTACLLEIARAMKENNIKTARPVIFAAFNGEENGLIGSKKFVKHLGGDMENVEMLNIDMIANKVDTPLHLCAMNKTQLIQDVYGIAKDMGMSVRYDIGKGNSDHANVENNGGEAVSFIESEQEEYHTPQDTIDIIDKKDLKDVVELVLRYLSTKI